MEQGKHQCYVCGKYFDEIQGRRVDLQACHKCGHFYCMEHIYAGNDKYKKLCKNCLIEVKKQENAVFREDEAFKKRMESIDTDVSQGLGSDPLPKPDLPKWEYKTLSFPLPKSISIEEWEDRPEKDDIPIDLTQNNPFDLSLLNQLGADGWEIINIIPNTQDLLIKDKRHPKYYTTASNIVTGYHLLLKRRL